MDAVSLMPPIQAPVVTGQEWHEAPAPVPVADHTDTCRKALMAGDGALLLITSLLATALTHGTSLAFALLLTATLLFIPALARLDLYPGFGLMRAERLRRRWMAALIWFPLLALATWQMQLAPAVALISGVLFASLSPLSEDIIRKRLIAGKRWGKPALMRGPERIVADLIRSLGQNPQLGLLPIRGQADLRAGEIVTTAILAPGTLINPADDLMQALYVLDKGGILHPLHHPEHWLARLVGHITPVNPRLAPWRALKRSIDLLVGSIALIIALPLMAITATIIYVADPGPVFYGQYRRGLNGKAIRIWKLRSMYQDSEQRLETLLREDLDVATEWQARYKLKCDPRIIKGIGHFIRKFSIDELPQLVSVLQGQLSLVGPRVFVDYDLKSYSAEDLRLRQNVLPGLTGLWQVAVRSAGDNRDKPDYDTAYVKNWSLWDDIDILYRTVDVVLTGHGAV